MIDHDQRRTSHVDVAIVGAGPAGLSAAIKLKSLGIDRVLVLERSGSAGGVPQFCHHLGFGVRDRHRVQTGPTYARSLVSRAESVGVDLRLNATVTGWHEDKSLLVSSEEGLSLIEADAVLIATGAREGSRASALVSGSRASGVLTTGSLQRLVYEHGFRVGNRAVIVGAELVSFSALLTLRSAGVKVVAMVTPETEIQLYSVLSPLRRVLNRWSRRFPLVPIHLSSEVMSIEGTGRVAGVQVRDNRTGSERRIDCDTVVFTGQWRPEREVAVAAGVRLNSGSRGPGIDESYMTSIPGVFAAGNVLRGIEQADFASLEGRRAAASIGNYLAAAPGSSEMGCPI